jgi:cell division transport system permease protein
LPRDSVTGHALIAVIAIMSFLAALTVGTARIARISVGEWKSGLSDEITIQIKPVEGRNIDADIEKALATARKTPGIAASRAYTKQESEKLLEPWLGKGADLKSLPVPRLIQLRVSGISTDDIDSLRRGLAENVPSALLNDHRGFSSRLVVISRVMTFASATILMLVLLATTLSVSFATRGAVAANRTTVEVLHFVGARDSFIAAAFQRHFLAVGFKGALIGGLTAAFLFALSRFAARLLDLFPISGDTAYLFGKFSLDAYGYLEIAATVIFVAAVTTIISRMTVHSTLRNID